MVEYSKLMEMYRRMKIRYIKNVGFDVGTVNFLKAIPYSGKFKRRVIEIRGALEIPPDGFGRLKEASMYISGTVEGEVKPVSNEILVGLGALMLVKEFALPANWERAMEELLLFNSALIYEREISLSSRVFGLPEKRFVGINMYARVSKDKLHDWIDKNWGSVESRFDNLALKKSAKVNGKNVGLKVEAFRMNEEGMNIEEITKELVNRYGGDETMGDFVCDKELIRKWIRRIRVHVEG